MPSSKLSRTLGLNPPPPLYPETSLIQYLNLKLAMMGQPTFHTDKESELNQMMAELLAHAQETKRLLADYLCPADRRIQDFLDQYLKDTGMSVRLPGSTFVLDRHGLARALSLPPDRDEFVSDLVNSYRVCQGILHNPRHDRRTTKGSFHIAEGGLPIPTDKLSVPKAVFAQMLQVALQPPEGLQQLPFTASQEDQAECFVSLLIRPVVCPAVPGFIEQKSMEIRMFAPGTLVSNLDFVESIFGNAGNPALPKNDAGLDTEHWTGHTGCIILAPQLMHLNKKDLGLPKWEDATERQRRDSMCWKSPEETYNDGNAFKLTARDERGVMITMIADNYFGYCKKEVKTQISYSANLFGLCEEEHAGGTIVYPSYDLGEEFSGFLHVKAMGHSFKEAQKLYGSIMDLKPEGYGIDKKYGDIFYVPETAHFDLHHQTVQWTNESGPQTIKLLPDRTYVRPSGYKIHMERTQDGEHWRLVSTVAEGLVCHKPCTVSGGGKSEISKPITDALLQGPVFVSEFEKDFDEVMALMEKDCSDRFLPAAKRAADHRTVLSPERSLGSVIKLLTPARRDFTTPYNEWLRGIPQYLKELVFVVKRFYKSEWGDDWRQHFSVDIINGTPGKELKCENQKLISEYLRVGYEKDGSWRTFGLRQDFSPASKQSLEDDITASVVVPSSAVSNLGPDTDRPSLKFVINCENRFFQRPDDAIHPGYDKQTERDLSQPGNFLSNYEPLVATSAKDLMEDSIGFNTYTEPMRAMIRSVHEKLKPAYFACNTSPRLVNGKPTKNPRYLQVRPDLAVPREQYLNDMATRMHRRIPLEEHVPSPVHAVVPGRRNNPPDAKAGIRPIAVYNPIHYMEMPELFMEFICSMTGKSPSTTGAGSEGALTKGPFNALLPIIDLNNALVSYLLTEYDGFVTAAGCVGPNARMDHDVSLLIPEVWCRMTKEERSPQFLMDHGFLERCEDMEHEGKKVLASRLGYRITLAFVRTFFGRMFNHPHMIFTEDMLKPELQDMAIFVDGMDNIIETQKRSAANYFEDDSMTLACPPLRALLHIMAEGSYQGRTLDHPDIRSLFTRESLIQSDWYTERLHTKQAIDTRLWSRHVDHLESFLARESHAVEARRIGIPGRLESARRQLKGIQSSEYISTLTGTLGAQPLNPKCGLTVFEE